MNHLNFQLKHQTTPATICGIATVSYGTMGIVIGWKYRSDGFIRNKLS